MNFVYDIYLNLNENLLDFFDWNKNDKLSHIKKIPIFKINEENFESLIINTIKVNKDFLLKIYNKTELWNTNNKIIYCSLFSNGNTIIGIQFDKNGKSIKKSFLYIDEELEILDTLNRLKETAFSFTNLKKNSLLLKTRKQIKEENFIKKELKNIDENKLNYIFFECFGKHEKNKKIIFNKINKLSINSKIYKNLYDILKLTAITKK